MRVLLVTDTLAPTYGWGRYAIGLIRALLEEGQEVRLLSPRGLCQVSDLRDLPAHGTVTSFVSQTRRISRLVLANALPIRRALADCDVVHCLTEPYAIPTALAAGRKPLLVSLHGTYAVRPFTRRAERPWYELAYRRANRLLPVSEFTRSLLPARFRGSQTQVVPDCVEIERFSAPAQSPERKGPPYLLSVGPVKRRKGYHVSLEAFAHVHAVRPDVEYWIAGGADDRALMAQLTARIDELGLRESVRFLGMVDDETLVRLYHQCATFWLLPVSDDLQFEGFGLVYWEAGACGRPSIGSRGSGAEDAIEDGVTGYLAPQGDTRAAAEAALRLLNDPDRATRMGDAARRRVRPWRDSARLAMGHYRDLTGGSTAALVAAPIPGSG